MSASPLVLLVYNRPALTEQVFARIRDARPSQLFVVADGPAAHRLDDAERCRRVREIVSNVDWDCEVQTDFSEQNLGLKARVGTGLDWVFTEVERAVVLEDDCVPHPDFFSYCDDLLARYSDDPMVAAITGNNFQAGRVRGSGSYYFSRYLHVWGWATWKRVWDSYDPEIAFWERWKASSDWLAMWEDPLERKAWERVFDTVGEVDSWAYPFLASMWHSEGWVATPNVNLVTNRGFGPDAVHTTDATSPLANMPALPLGPLEHPTRVARDAEADRFVFDRVFGGRELRQRRTPHGFVFWAIRRLGGRFLRTIRSLRRANPM